MNITDRNKAPKDLIKVYEDIDGLKVIRELLLHKGVGVCNGLRVSKRMLDEMALIVYGLKSNPTNKLYVGFALDRFYKRNGLVTPNGSIKVPVIIYDEVEKINSEVIKQVKFKDK